MRHVHWRFESGQNERGARLCVESLDTPLEYYLTNNMFDETKLTVVAPVRPLGGEASYTRPGLQYHFEKAFLPIASHGHHSTPGLDANVYGRLCN